MPICPSSFLTLCIILPPPSPPLPSLCLHLSFKGEGDHMPYWLAGSCIVLGQCVMCVYIVPPLMCVYIVPPPPLPLHACVHCTPSPYLPPPPTCVFTLYPLSPPLPTHVCTLYPLPPLSLHVCVHCTPLPPLPTCMCTLYPLSLHMCVSLPSPNHRLPGYFSQRCHNTLPLFRTSSFWGHGSNLPRTLFQVPAMTLHFFKW